MLVDQLNFLTGTDSRVDIAGGTLTKPTDGAVLMRFVSGRIFDLPAGLTGSVAVSTVAPTAQTSYDIKLNGSSIGSIDYAIGANVGTFTAATITDVVVGDILTVEAPGTADATHDGLAWTFFAIGD